MNINAEKRGIFMEIRVLRYFLEIAREGNMTRVTEYLHVSQPTLWKKHQVFTPITENY